MNLKLDEKKILSDLKSQWPAIEIPGYWDSLIDNCEQWATAAGNNPFWSKIRSSLNEWKSDHRKITGNSLLSKEGLPNFTHKGKNRILTKIVSKVKRDSNFIKEAFQSTDPPIPQLNDLVRVRLSCQFIDGVEYLANKIIEEAKNIDAFVEHEKMGSLEGYFAQHIIFKDTFIHRYMSQTNTVTINCEIQIGTILSTAIWDSTHKVYEDSRNSIKSPSDWQWDPKDPRFISNQIGHMIHLADGLLVGLRESVNSKKLKRKQK